jgi:hypothetical protein
MDIRAYIGGKITRELSDICAKVDVNAHLLNEALIDELKARAASIENDNEYERIRLLYNEFEPRNHIKSHLAALFEKDLSLLCKIVSNKRRGWQGLRH